MIFNFLIGAVSCLATMQGVEESPINNFEYPKGSSNEHIGIQNVVLRGNNLYLKSGISEQSLIRWDIPNNNENWAFSLTFNELDLGSNEKAGIYLRYTDEQPLIGKFKGGEGVYNGFTVGLEHVGKSFSIVYAKNDGQDYSQAEDYVVRKDEINPARFKNVEEITLKVICTNKNLKLEIYERDKLIYDNFRIYDVKSLKLNKKGRYFGIVTDYSHVPSGKAFELKHAQLYKRIESESYQVYKSYSEKITSSYKDIREINHHDDDVKELIHLSSSVMLYIKNIIGDLPETRLSSLANESKKELGFIGDRIAALEKIVKSEKTKSNFDSKLNDFEIRIKQIQGLITDLNFTIEEGVTNTSNYTHIIQYIIFGAGCTLLYILGSREISHILELRSKLNK